MSLRAILILGALLAMPFAITWAVDNTATVRGDASIEKRVEVEASAASAQPASYARIFLNENVEILCRDMYAPTDHICKLAIRSARAERLHETELILESPDKAIIPSPQGRSVLVVLDRVAYAISTHDGMLREIATAPPGTAFGTYTSLPAFEPSARWVDDATVSLDVFSQNSSSGLNSMTENGEWVELIPRARPLDTLQLDVRARR